MTAKIIFHPGQSTHLNRQLQAGALWESMRKYCFGIWAILFINLGFAQTAKVDDTIALGNDFSRVSSTRVSKASLALLDKKSTGAMLPKYFADLRNEGQLAEPVLGNLKECKMKLAQVLTNLSTSTNHGELAKQALQKDVERELKKVSAIELRITSQLNFYERFASRHENSWLTELGIRSDLWGEARALEALRLQIEPYLHELIKDLENLSKPPREPRQQNRTIGAPTAPQRGSQEGRLRGPQESKDMFDTQ